MRPILIVLLTAGPLFAQRPIAPPPEVPIPERTSRLKPKQYAITVTGCVLNGKLRVAEGEQAELPFETLRVSEFILEGPKEMLRQIQEQHKGHYDEIAGVATVPPPPDDADANVETKKLGPIRVTAGRRDEKGPVRSAPRQIKLRVASLTHISEGCDARP